MLTHPTHLIALLFWSLITFHPIHAPGTVLGGPPSGPVIGGPPGGPIVGGPPTTGAPIHGGKPAPSTITGLHYGK